MTYLLQTVLAGRYTITAVPDAYQGMQELKKKTTTNLVLVDLDYQKEENLDFIQHVKTSTLYNIPVVVLLSELDDNTIKKFVTSQVSDYFQKPFNPLELIKTVDDLIPAPSAR